MKKIALFAVLLMFNFIANAQEKTTVKKDDSKWKMRVRAIAAIPPSTSYTLGTTDVKIGMSVVPEVDFTYFFTDHLAAELILATTQHKVKAKDASGTTDLGKVWLLPPTLNLQYHFNLKGFDPYVGAGINYTIFYGVKDDAASLSYKNNVGFSTQVGLDYKITDKLFLNVDLKKIFLKTDVTVDGATPTKLSGVKVNPFIIGLGVGFKL